MSPLHHHYQKRWFSRKQNCEQNDYHRSYVGDCLSNHTKNKIKILENKDKILNKRNEKMKCSFRRRRKWMWELLIWLKRKVWKFFFQTKEKLKRTTKKFLEENGIEFEEEKPR